MHGVQWYSFKHNTWATVTDDPKTKNGYYTVRFESGIYRRYTRARIEREVAHFETVNLQLDTPVFESVGNVAATGIHSESLAVPGITFAVPAEKAEILDKLVKNTMSADKPKAAKPAKRGVLVTLCFEGKD